MDLLDVSAYCTKCNGCSSKRNYTTFTSAYSIPKRLLVALSIVVVIAMCLTTVESRSIEHKRRHHREDKTEATETKLQNELHRRQQRHSATTLPKRPRRTHDEKYKDLTKRITKKLKNTKRSLVDIKKLMSESRVYSHYGKLPVWLPSVNFVDIYNHNYRKNSHRHKDNSTISERKFNFLMPKLYKTLAEYLQLFKVLMNLEVMDSDEPFVKYNSTRTKVLENTIILLHSTLGEIGEDMVAVNTPLPDSSKFYKNLEALKTRVTTSTCLHYDFHAMRAYSNVITNWLIQLRCSKNSKILNNRCAEYDKKMMEKSARKQNKDKTNVVQET